MATSEKLINIGSKHEDVQNRPDDRNVAINEVGICDLKIPLVLKGCEKDRSVTQHVQALFSLSVDLDASKKGIHMSRLLETALDHNKELSFAGIENFLEDLSKRQLAKKSYIKIEFDYFFTKVAPVSGIPSPQAYRCILEGFYSSDEGFKLKQSVEVPVKTLCPCSKEISDYGAHNQRSKVCISSSHEHQGESEIRVTLEDIVDIAENGASSPLYPILKREDERHVTMSAYDKPCFVEDVVRNIAVELNGDDRFSSYEIRVINFESIHSHNAFAVIKKDKS